MGEAARRRKIEASKFFTDTKYSELWPCANCSADPSDPYDNVVFEVRNGVARCIRCDYFNNRESFGFATYWHGTGIPAEVSSKVEELREQRVRR